MMKRSTVARLLLILLTAGSIANVGDTVAAAELSEAQLAQARSDAGLNISLPVATDQPVRGLGLFIGISRYARLPKHDLNGSVNDAIGLHAVFTRRFGITHACMLTNGQATSSNIKAALASLISAADKATKGTNTRIPVVITYSGHGIQIDSDEAASAEGETDGKDEYWVASDEYLDDGYISATHLIKDDLLKDVCNFIAARGGHVVLISDSCHSGTIHRTTEMVRSLGKDVVNSKRKAVSSAPDIFKGFVRVRDGSRGFVSYSACRDDQKAYETKDKNGIAFGRLSSSLIKVLSTLPPRTTYDELAEMVAVEFSERRFSTQTPQFHKSSGKTDELFMNGGYAPPHANLVSGSLQAGQGVLNMGQYHGVESGAVFKLFANLDDLSADRNSIGTATVMRVDAVTCPVKIESKAKIDRGLVVARLDMIRFGGFKVFVAKTAPKAIHELVGKMSEHKQLQIAEERECDMAVYPMETSSRIGIFPSVALPDPATGKGGQALHVITDRSEDQLAYAVARTLLRQARSDRFFSLDFGNDRISVSLEPLSRSESGDYKLNEVRKRIDGVLRLAAGDAFRFKIENRTNKPIYVYVFGSRPDGSLAQMYPDREDHEHIPIPARMTGSVPSSEPFAALRSGDEKIMRARAKIIATAEPFNFRPLLMEPDIGKSETRSGDSPHALVRFVNDLLRGDQATRGSSGDLTNWASTTIVFDIEHEK